MTSPPEFLDKISSLSIEHRDYQLEAVEEIIANISDHSIVLNYPYGTGKTVVTLLTFLRFKLNNPNAKFVFTSAREASALRCRQALEMAKTFGFLDELGYLYEPKGKGLSWRQKLKMYQASTAIFAPITKLMNDRFQIKRRMKYDILDSIDLFVIDEATDIVARYMSGFRLSKFFDELFRVRSKGQHFPILALTGSRDKTKTQSVVNLLGKNTLLMRRFDLVPYKTRSEIKKIKNQDFIKMDQIISNQLNKPIETIQNILDPNLSRLDIMKYSYGGIVDRLYAVNTFPASLGKHEIKNKEEKQELINAFLRLFKLSHARLLLLESTIGEFLNYIEKEENIELFKTLQKESINLIRHRVELPLFDNPEITIKRGLLQPKIITALEIIYSHVSVGAQVLIFTRYLALGSQIANLLKKLHFPNVKYLSGKVPEESRRIIINEFEQGDASILVFTPVGGRGLNLAAADIVIHLDITSSVDDMIQRRERARGCDEFILVLEGTSEEGKIEEYSKLIEQLKE